MNNTSKQGEKKMPPKSEKQREAAAIAKKVKEGKMAAKPGSASAQMAESMSGEQLHEFAIKPQGVKLPRVAKPKKAKKKTPKKPPRPKGIYER
jgi:hypothetical protein